MILQLQMDTYLKFTMMVAFTSAANIGRDHHPNDYEDDGNGDGGGDGDWSQVAERAWISLALCWNSFAVNWNHFARENAHMKSAEYSLPFVRFRFQASLLICAFLGTPSCSHPQLTSYVYALQELEQGGNPVEPWSHHLEPGFDDLELGGRISGHSGFEDDIELV